MIEGFAPSSLHPTDDFSMSPNRAASGLRLGFVFLKSIRVMFCIWGGATVGLELKLFATKVDGTQA